MTTQEQWEEWVRTLANSTNPRDVDLLVAKIAVLLNEHIPTSTVLEEIEKLKFESVEGGSKELPYTEYPTAKPVHESNEIFMQHAHNQALDDLKHALITNSKGV